MGRSEGMRGLVFAVAGLLLAGACSEASTDQSTSTTSSATTSSTTTSSTTTSSTTTTTLVTDTGPFAYDVAAPLDVTERPLTPPAFATFTHVTYRSFDGEVVPASFLVPRFVTGPVPCVVVGHGLGGTKEIAIALYGEMLVRAGYAVFAIDARFHGERMSPATADLSRDPQLVRSLFQDTVVDLRRGIDYLEQQPACTPGGVGLIGISMGGFHGALLAGTDTRVEAPILLFSGADWRTWLSTARRELSAVLVSPDDPAALDTLVSVIDPIDPARWVGNITPRPVLMVNGDADDIVPPAAAGALYAAAREPKTALSYQGGHSPEPAEDIRVREAMLDWLAESFPA